jgi:hypothetical protein
MKQKPDGLQSHATTPRKGRQDGNAAALEASTAASNSPEFALSGPHMKDEVNDMIILHVRPDRASSAVTPD